MQVFISWRALWRSVALVALLANLGAAHAQRRAIPVAELVDVPVSMATSKPLTAQQVRGAIVAASLASEWDVEPDGEGVLRLKVFKDFDSRVELRAIYSATNYSLRYVSSEGLRYGDSEDLAQAALTAPLAVFTEKWRQTRAAAQPEFKFAVDRPVGVIHPTYEQWVYELSAGIRRHLRVIE